MWRYSGVCYLHHEYPFRRYTYEHSRCVSHPCRALVPGVRGGHRCGTAPSLGNAGALQHAGMETCVSPGVFGQVVAPHEALFTQRTVEALLARVRAVVARQLVRSGKLFTAVCPGAFEGTFPGVDPEVGFEV